MTVRRDEGEVGRKLAEGEAAVPPTAPAREPTAEPSGAAWRVFARRERYRPWYVREDRLLRPRRTN